MVMGVQTSPRVAMNSVENSVLERQLLREIECLERQLERIRGAAQDDMVDLEAYESMIASRRRMLRNMPSMR